MTHTPPHPDDSTPRATPRVGHAELVARALDALAPAEKARVDAALARDETLRHEFEAIAGHLLEYDRLPPAPPAPAFARITARIADDLHDHSAAPDLRILRLQDAAADTEEGRGRRGHARTPGKSRAWRVLAVAAAAVLAGLFLWRPWASTVNRGTTLVPGVGIELVRAGVPLSAPAHARRDVRPGDVVRCREPAELRLADRVRIVLDAASEVRIENADAVTVLSGRTWFEVEPGAFEVRTAYGPVRVLGTAFEVDVRGGKLAVAVAHGRVAVSPHRSGPGAAASGSSAHDETIEIGTGETLANQIVDQNRPPGEFESIPFPFPAGDWFARPRLAVRQPSVPLTTETRTLRLDLVISNPGQVPLTVRGPSTGRTPIWLHFEDAEGRPVRELPARAANIVAGRAFLTPGGSRDLAPGLEKVITIEIRAPFTSPGTYFCRALYRPAGRPGVLSEAQRLEVR